MHDTAYRIGGLVMRTYLPSSPARILEVGAQNVNGSLRDHAPRNAEYVGLDFEEGKGVDLVVTGLQDWTVPDASFDLVMASSVFEHDKAFWRTFLAMCAKAKPGGHIYISAPSNGAVHRYPKDYWRFYPDSGLALEEWARDQSFEVSLIESFIAEREGEVWNDFCAVFRRGPSDADLNQDFVFEKVASTNALSWRSSVVFNPVDDSEDTRLLRAAHEDTQRWVRHCDHLNALHAEEMERHNQQIARLTQEIDQQARSVAMFGETVNAKDQKHAALQSHAEELAKELDRLNAEMQGRASDHERHIRQIAATSSALQSRLAQREEEAAQAWACAEERKQESDRFAAQAEKARTQLVDANSWVERLALTRTQMERRVARMEKALAIQAKKFELLQRRNSILAERTQFLSASPQVAANISSESFSPQSAQMPLAVAETSECEPSPSISDEPVETLSAPTEVPAPEPGKANEALKLHSRSPGPTIAGTEWDELEKVRVATKAQVERSEERLQTVTRDLIDARARLEDSSAELASLGGMFIKTQNRAAEFENRAAELERQNEWLREAGSFLLERGKWWWRFMPRAWQRRKRDERLMRRGLFDMQNYSTRYPDVALAEPDPFRHFLYYGLAEYRRYDQELQS